MNFAHPGWLALLLLVPLLGVGALLAFRLKRQQWSAFVAPRLRGALLKRSSALPRWLAIIFLLASCAALIIALARPRGDAGTKTEKTMGRNVMIALDISKSMRVSDVKPDRLTQAKVVIYELLEAMPNERLGFIGFAGTPYAYAPLTIDHSAVREITEQVDETWAPLGGSDLPAAVKLAIETLKKTGQKNNALVIVSDGEEIHDDNRRGELDEMIAEAERSGVYIIAIGVGTEAGDYVPNPDFPNARMVDRNGKEVISQLRTEVLSRLAEGTKGRFAVAGSGQDIPELVNSVVKGLDAFEMEGRERRISIEFYQWLVFPAILLLMGSILAGTRWRKVRTGVATAAAATVLMIPQARASEASNAMRALQEKNYQEARESYHRLADRSKSAETRARYRLGEATAAYRQGDFREARTAFSKALLSGNPQVEASGHFGLGNTLFQLGWKSLTDESYPTDPGAVPDLPRFDILAKEALAKLRESGAESEADSQDFVRFQTLITNWADAVRHYDSAVRLAPGTSDAESNRTLTMTYLKRLEELLEQEENETEEAMPQVQPGEGEPQEGEGDGEPQEGEGQEGEDSQQKGPNGNEKDEDGEGDEGEKQEKDGKNGDEPEQKPGDKSTNPNESAEERAERILKENADLEKGPLTPGRREFRSAEKDW